MSTPDTSAELSVLPDTVRLVDAGLRMVNDVCGVAFCGTVRSASGDKSIVHGGEISVTWIEFVEVSVPSDAVTLMVACPVAPLGVKVSVRLLEVPLASAVPRPELLARATKLVEPV